jgi:hypothetical protein
MSKIETITFKINHCGECNHCMSNWSEKRAAYRNSCELTRKQLKQDELWGEIPEWCPLPNSKPSQKDTTICDVDELSNCCLSSVFVDGDIKEGTHYYVCSKCGNPCDVRVKPIIPIMTYDTGTFNANNTTLPDKLLSD